MGLFGSVSALVGGKVAAGALVVLVASNLAWWGYASHLSSNGRVAKADQATAEGARDLAATERDAWKGKARELDIANLAGQKAIAYLQQELKLAQGERRRLLDEGQQAIAEARARALDAEQAHKTFVDRYAKQVRNPDCAGALAVLQTSCPALEGY